MSRMWVEHCEGDPRDVYPRSVRFITPFRPPDFPKRFTDDELVDHLSWRCGSQLSPDVLDPDGFLFGAVWYAPEDS